jgi:hypothetical protein
MEGMMKYKALKEISLISIAQAGPKGCDEFNREFMNLARSKAVNFEAACYRKIGTELVRENALVEWAESNPKRIEWLIDNGFIERVEDEVRCIFCGNGCVMRDNSKNYWVACCNYYCGCLGPERPTKQEAIDAFLHPKFLPKGCE